MTPQESRTLWRTADHLCHTPRAQGLQTPQLCPIFTGSPKPINIPTRILCTKNPASTQVSFLCFVMRSSYISGKQRTEYLSPVAHQTHSPAHTLVCPVGRCQAPWQILLLSQERVHLARAPLHMSRLHTKPNGSLKVFLN